MKINPNFLLTLAEIQRRSRVVVQYCFWMGFAQGLPGVCLTGPEVHSHIDEGLFRRLGLPEELIATGYEAYIRAVLRLVEEHDWREILQHRLLDNDVEQVLFQGHPEKFAAVISDAWQQVRPGVVPSGTVPKARRRKSL